MVTSSCDDGPTVYNPVPNAYTHNDMHSHDHLSHANHTAYPLDPDTINNHTVGGHHQHQNGHKQRLSHSNSLPPQHRSPQTHAPQVATSPVQSQRPGQTTVPNNHPRPESTYNPSPMQRPTRSSGEGMYGNGDGYTSIPGQSFSSQHAPGTDHPTIYANHQNAPQNPYSSTRAETPFATAPEFQGSIKETGNTPLLNKTLSQEHVRKRSRVSGDTIKKVVDGARFTLTGLNFGMTVAFAVTLAIHAFTMPGIIGVEVFHADRVLQSYGTTPPPATIDAFVKNAFGVESEVLYTMNSVTTMADKVPNMYELSGSSTMLRVDAVHCNFMLFTALWSASSFALAVTQVPWSSWNHWSSARVVVVHAWNLTGLILTLVMFSATTKWSGVPGSNLFYSLVNQLMAWLYQYYYMVECTQSWTVNGGLKLKFNTEIGDDMSTHMRQLIYMEFSVVMPLILVATMMPGAIGIDQWRVQTAFFAAWAVFALLGLHLRFRKSLSKTDNHQVITDVSAAGVVEEKVLSIGKSHGRPGLDALGYLTYAIILAYLLLIHALGVNTFYDAPYATPSVTQSRWGARLIVMVTGIIVLETLFKSIAMRVDWMKFYTKKKAIS
ncbi:hypothetical protein T484DRAFT_1747599 [Baffinella frigidus]|nr:hypothetical protein T484DRAFT_1747599 [Cryptophyta sp. CCMP2293]